MDPFINATSFINSTIFAISSTTAHVNTPMPSPTVSVTSEATASAGIIATSNSDFLQPTMLTISSIYPSNTSVVYSSSIASYAPLATFTDQPRCSEYYLDSAGDQSRIYCNASLQAPDLSTGLAENFESCIAMCSEVNKRNASASCIAAQFYNGTGSFGTVCALKMNTQNLRGPTTSMMSISSTATFDMGSGTESQLSLAENASGTAIVVTSTELSTDEKSTAVTTDLSQASPTPTDDVSTSMANPEQPAESASSGNDLESGTSDNGGDPDAGSGTDDPIGSDDGGSDGKSDGKSGHYAGSNFGVSADSSEMNVKRSLYSHEKGAYSDQARDAMESRYVRSEGQREVDFHGRQYFTIGSLVLLDAPFTFVALLMANANQPTPDDPTPAFSISAPAASIITPMGSTSSIFSSSPTLAATDFYVGTTTIVITSTVSRYICPQDARIALNRSRPSKFHEVSSEVDI